MTWSSQSQCFISTFHSYVYYIGSRFEKNHSSWQMWENFMKKSTTVVVVVDNLCWRFMTQKNKKCAFGFLQKDKAIKVDRVINLFSKKFFLFILLIYLNNIPINNCKCQKCFFFFFFFPERCKRCKQNLIIAARHLLLAFSKS